jgi:hypothetical protein
MGQPQANNLLAKSKSGMRQRPADWTATSRRDVVVKLAKVHEKKLMVLTRGDLRLFAMSREPGLRPTGSRDTCKRGSTHPLRTKMLQQIDR